MKKMPMRSCVVTREKFPKQELIRVVRTPEGTIQIDEKGKMNGRGAYLKKDLAVIEKAEKNKIVDRVLETKVPTSIFEKLKELVK